MTITDVDRWQHCREHGFPSRNQGPAEVFDRMTNKMVKQNCWTAYGPGSIRGQGQTPDQAVDSAITLTKGQK